MEFIDKKYIEVIHSIFGIKLHSVEQLEAFYKRIDSKDFTDEDREKLQSKMHEVLFSSSDVADSEDIDEVVHPASNCLKINDLECFHLPKLNP